MRDCSLTDQTATRPVSRIVAGICESIMARETFSKGSGRTLSGAIASCDHLLGGQKSNCEGGIPSGETGGRRSRVAERFVAGRSSGAGRTRRDPKTWLRGVNHPEVRNTRPGHRVIRTPQLTEREELLGKVGGEVMGRVIMAPAEKGQAVFMRVFGVSSQNLLFCQRRSRGLVDVTMARSLRSSVSGGAHWMYSAHVGSWDLARSVHRFRR